MHAAPITPTRDDEVIEVLPATAGNAARIVSCASASRRDRDDPALALAVARRYLAQAHESGDPRFAGLALAALRAWPDARATPNDVLLLRATLEQYLHEFDASVAHLRQLLARPGSERNSQAWLTLATVLRVQGRYAESDEACAQVGRAGADAATRPRAWRRTRRCAASRRRRARSFQTLLADPRLAAGHARVAHDHRSPSSRSATVAPPPPMPRIARRCKSRPRHATRRSPMPIS